MKRTFKRTAAVALTGVLAAGLLAGCGSKEAAVLDGTQTVATINGTEIPLGIVSLAAREQQAQTEALYLSFLGSIGNIWDIEADEESGETYGELQVHDMLEQVELWYAMSEHAADYGAEITDEDKTAIQAAAAEFMAANSEETIAVLSVTQEHVEKLLELETIATRLYYSVRNEAEVDISDEAATQSSFSYVSINIVPEDLTEEDIATRRENAQSILDSLLEDPEADLDEIAAAVDESYSGLTGTYTRSADEEDSSSYPEEIKTVLRDLEDGEVYTEVLEVEDYLYVLRKDLDVDEDATESRRSTLESNARSDYYTDTTQGWLDAAEITVNDEVLHTLTITDSHSFTIFTPTATPAPTEEPAEEEEVLEEIEGEVVEEPVEEVVEEAVEEIEDAEDAEDTEAVEETQTEEEESEETTEE